MSHPGPSWSLRQGCVSRDRGVGRLFADSQPQVGRPLRGKKPIHQRGDIAVERRNEGAKVRQTEQGTIILKRVVSRAHDAIAVAASVADQHDGKPVQADVVADLLVGTGVDKWGNAVHPRTKPGSRQAGGHRDHVLLGNSRVDETGPENVAQRFERRKPRSPVKKTNSGRLAASTKA